MGISTQKNGIIILLFGPSGSGKGTLMRMLLQDRPELVYAPSYSSRAMRPGESQGDPYYFKSKEEFERHIADGDMLEWAEYSGNLYGTAKEVILNPIKEGKIAIKEMEVQGIELVLKALSDQNIKLVYIDAGNWDRLSRRINERGEMSTEDIEKRHKRYLAELSYKEKADCVVKNYDGKLDEAKRSLIAYIDSILPK